jgi:hypothetical protein
MRALMLYIAVAVAAPVYGGQVCPFMEGVPVLKLEGYVALPMVLILGLRQVDDDMILVVVTGNPAPFSDLPPETPAANR